MKILVASTPAMGHLNPLLAIGRMLIAEGHEVVGLTGTILRDRIEGIGAKFHPLPAGADFDLRDVTTVVPEILQMPPGPEVLRIGVERVFVGGLPAQDQGLREVLRDFPADVILSEDMYFGVLPMLLGQRAKRPPIVLCGTSYLHCRREDGLPHGLGLPPPSNRAEREESEATAREHDRVFEQPLSLALNRCLKSLGVGPVSTPFFNSGVEHADAFMQLTVPSFEYPCIVPPSVRFVGTPPIVPKQVPLPSWADELDGTRKVVLVTQGTVANHDFGHLVGPTLAALANEPDLLVIATAGGRSADAIPGPIPANARVASYLPFEWALAKADMLVTNAGYGSVNQAMSFGLPIVAAGQSEDKPDVSARIAWSGVGINLGTNTPTPQALHDAVRAVLDKSDYRTRAASMAAEFAAVDTRAEILRMVNEAAQTPNAPSQATPRRNVANRR